MGTDGSPHGGTPAMESHFRPEVVAAIIYGFVRTVLTGKLSEHIYAPDLGPKSPS